MTNLSKNQSIKIIAATCINKLCPHPSNLELSVTIQSVFDNTTGISSHYQVALHGAGDALTCSIPKVFNESDLRSIAIFLSKHVPHYYSMFDRDHTRKLEHKIFSFAETQINADASAGLYISQSTKTDNGVLMVAIDRFAKTQAVKVSIIKDGKYAKQLNSRELRRFLKNNPQTVVCGARADLNYLEQAITHPDKQAGYNSDSDVHDDYYHLMTNAHRLYCKLSQINDEQLRFSKRGVAVIYDVAYTESMPPSYT